MARVRIFECGRTFARDDTAQTMRIGGLAFGSALPEQWGSPLRAVDFFDVKGDLEALASPLTLATTASARPWLHPGRSADVRVAGRQAGWIGELHPRLLRRLELPAAPIVFELNLESLTRVPVPRALPVSRLPALRRDIAIIVNENIAIGDILHGLRELRQPGVESLDIFDVYRGPELPEGTKSVAILVLMRDTERTLTDADGERIVGQLLAILTTRFGATLRSQVSR